MGGKRTCTPRTPGRARAAAARPRPRTDRVTPVRIVLLAEVLVEAEGALREESGS